MRKRDLLVAACLATGIAVGFTSCSNDDTWNGNGIENPADADAQQIVLQVSNSGDGVTSRAGRPLESSEAGQKIDEVKVLICNNEQANNVVYATTIDDWMNSGSKAYTTNGHGREAVLTIPDDKKLGEGSYTVYAIGYSDNSNYSNLNEKITKIGEGGTFSPDVILAQTNNMKPEEIFAGSLDLSVTAGKGFRTPVVLNRQVAGAFFYVNNIPLIEGATKIQLVASAKNTNLVLGKFANANLTGNGEQNGANVKYVINGTEQETTAPHVICQTALSEWFTNPNLEDGETGTIKVEDNWKETEKGQKYAKGSVFAGEFVIPFAKVTLTSEQTTLTLQMVTDNGEVKRSWKVKLPSTDGQISNHSLWSWNVEENDFKETKDRKDTSTEYDIVRNHLYTIGKKMKSDTPTDPTDPDEPEPLNTKQEFTLKVCDNWEVIHKMEIE